MSLFEPHDIAISAETVFEVRTASQARISPDGEQVTFLVHDWIPEQEKARQRLWTVAANGGEPRPLTKGIRQDADFCWSPDSHRLAYISRVESDENGKKDTPRFQLYIKEGMDGIERQVCTMAKGARNIAWSPDGRQLAFLSFTSDEAHDDPLVLSDPQQGQHRQLWCVYADSDIPEAITPAHQTVWSYAWSPDGQYFAVYYTDGPEETDWYRGQIGLVPAGGGAIRQIGQLKRQAWNLAWSPDSKQLAYISGEWSDPDRGGGDIFLYTPENGETRNLTPGLDWSPTWLQWFPEGQRILCAGWDSLGTRIAILEAVSGAINTLDNTFLIGDRHWPHLSTSQDMQRIVATHSEQHPYDVWLMEYRPDALQESPHRQWRRCTRLNPITEETIAMHPTEHIHYEGAGGWQIDAVVTRPRHNPESVLPPLIVSVHGGPSGIWLDDWEYYRSQLLAEAGYVVLRPNIRGSMGRGANFADAVIGDMGGQDLQDVLKGVDYLVSRKLVNGERVGIMGWSYGGFMSAWAVTQTHRFKAAVVGAGVTDYHSFHAQTNIQDWDMRFLGEIDAPVSPQTHTEIYRQHSPITFARNIQTPTLIVHGEKDACVPLNQAYAFYRALQEQAIPTQLVIYPREGHGLGERKHLRDYTQRFLDWFKRYL